MPPIDYFNASLSRIAGNLLIDLSKLICYRYSIIKTVKILTK